MKLLTLFYFTLTLQTYNQKLPIIKARSASHYIGKEVIVYGKFITGGNSSYAQFAWFYLGSDTSHKQLKVIIRGNQYASNAQNSIVTCNAQNVEIKGIIKGGKEIYLDATDTIRLHK
ncbi:MAG TPA: hypothetical protein VGN20_28375 [Mucilaginibacter sp.]|jgi:hypothetical protein